MSKRRNNEITALETLASELQRVGFSDYEARAYLALLQLGTASTAYEISKVAGIPRANAYSALESLSGKRAVQPVFQSPLRYVPLEPDILLGRILEETTTHCEHLEKKLMQLRKSAPRNDHVWTLTGELEVNSKISEMIESAEHHIWIKAHETRLMPHEKALRAAAARGVQVMIVLFGEDVTRFTYGNSSRTYLHEGNGIPVGVAHHLITMSRDFTEALMVNMDEAAYGAYTRSRPVVNMAASLLRHEIYFAELFEHLGPEIEAIFGPALFELRRKYLPREQSENLVNILEAAGRSAADRKTTPARSPTSQREHKGRKKA